MPFINTPSPSSWEIVMERGASLAEIEGVRDAFAEANIPVDVLASIEFRSVGDIPWVVYVMAPFVVFVSAFAKAAGSEAGTVVGHAVGEGVVNVGKGGGRALKKLVGRIYESKRKSTSPAGTVVLRCSDVPQEIILGDEVTEEGYQMLLDLDLSQRTRSGDLRWDSAAGEWRDAWDIWEISTSDGS
jgi:hypothetical protein